MSENRVLIEFVSASNDGLSYQLVLLPSGHVALVTEVDGTEVASVSSLAGDVFFDLWVEVMDDLGLETIEEVPLTEMN